MNEEYKEEVTHTVESDAYKYARGRLSKICTKRGGKFKLSEKQLVDEMAATWMIAELSAAERLMRSIEADKDLIIPTDGAQTMNMMLGEFHMFIVDLHKILEKRHKMFPDLNIEDLIWGKYTTDKVAEHYNARKREASNGL